MRTRSPLAEAESTGMNFDGREVRRDPSLWPSPRGVSGECTALFPDARGRDGTGRPGGGFGRCVKRWRAPAAVMRLLISSTLR